MPANRPATRSQDRRSEVPDWSAGSHRHVARQNREDRQIAATQRLPGLSAKGTNPIAQRTRQRVRSIRLQ